MTGAPPHLLRFLQEHDISFEVLSPGAPTPTVPAAAAAVGVPENHILKTLLFAGDDAQHVVAIACGPRRVDRQRLAAATGHARLRAAKPEAVLAVTRYPAGGVAPVAFSSTLTVVVDSAVAALPEAIGGGGQDHLLLRISPADIIRVNNALVTSITESD